MFALIPLAACAAINAKKADARKVISIADRKERIQKQKEKAALAKILKRAKDLNW